MIFHEYVIDTARACRKLGIKNVAVTAGYICPEPRAEFYGHMDAVNIDLKAFTEDFYHKVCGAHLQPVLETLIYVAHETPVWLEITNLMIPGLNDSEREIDEMTRWVVETPRAGGTYALHRLLPGLADVRPAADPGRDAEHGATHRLE